MMDDGGLVNPRVYPPPTQAIGPCPACSRDQALRKDGDWTRWFVAAVGIVCLALAVSMCGCTPTLQVARWHDLRGPYAATIRCTSGAVTLAAEVTSASPLGVRDPTSEVTK